LTTRTEELRAPQVINAEAEDIYHFLFMFMKEAIDLWTV